MRYLIRCLVLCLVVLAAALPAAAEPPATIASLKAKANQAAAKYAAARATYEKLGDQVAALEHQVSDLEARIGPLREQVTRQAVAVYQGDVAVAAVNHFEAAAAMMRSDRAAHLVADITARQVPAIDSLVAARQRIRDRQADLNARRHEQDVAMASLTAQRDQIAHELQALATALPPRPARQPRARASRSTAGLGQRIGGAAPGAPAAFVCPIDGPLAFGDDFGAPRGGGRRHMGVDLLSPKGTLNVAVVNGTIETRPWSGGGITIFLRGDDGHTYIYMHLLRIEGAVPRRVTQGEVIGLTGNTGHSYGYHTHFEYHPNGGNAVSPYPLLSAACL
ncbi:MAG: peptidoglycan DD-metalloendopeptidase family protein [Actinomycetota bacterium]|jgi:murein DD-endopeptidase MepM/ murein hydrolase activator NlpD